MTVVKQFSQQSRERFSARSSVTNLVWTIKILYLKHNNLQEVWWLKMHERNWILFTWPGYLSLRQLWDWSPGVPTIRKALRYAAKSDPSLAKLPKKMVRSIWHEDHAIDVFAQKQNGLGTNELVEHFGKSDTTIRKAIKHAKKLLSNDKLVQTQ